MHDCIFCKIIKGEIPCAKVYESESVIAFLDISPVHPGHTLVVPKDHYESILDITEDEYEKLQHAVWELCPAILKATHADGISVGQSNKAAAGQVISHIHVHIMPRFANDGLKLWPQGKYQEGQMDEVKKRIVSALQE
ncbi:HIT family protein [Candidatus Woesearchaeota archaeon]|nr:HIT family protein [Candidatus Woesearchaeota archaeon]